MTLPAMLVCDISLPAFWWRRSRSVDQSFSYGPLTTGLGRGVAGAAGTQQFADQLGQAFATVCPLFPEPDKTCFGCDLASQLMHTLGGIATNAEQGVCVLL